MSEAKNTDLILSNGVHSLSDFQKYYYFTTSLKNQLTINSPSFIVRNVEPLYLFSLRPVRHTYSVTIDVSVNNSYINCIIELPSFSIEIEFISLKH